MRNYWLCCVSLVLFGFLQEAEYLFVVDKGVRVFALSYLFEQKEISELHRAEVICY